MDLDYEETRQSCPNCGTLNQPDTGLPCSMCNYIGASVESPLRRHLDERRIARESTPAGCDERNQPGDVDGWPVRGCVSPTHGAHE